MSEARSVAPDNARLVELLEGVPLLAAVPRELKLKMVPHLRTRTAADGERILRAGEPGDAMYIVASGSVRIHVTEAVTGSGVELARVGRGEPLGEMALLGGEPRSADATAIGAVELVQVNGEVFRRLVHARPEVALEMCRALADRLRAANADRGLRFGTLKDRPPNRALLDLMPGALVRQLEMVPVEEDTDGILIATPNPENRSGLETIRRIFRGREIRILAVGGEDFAAWVQRHVPETTFAVTGLAPAERAARVSYDASAPPAPEGRSTGPSATDTLSLLLLDAIERSASDMHIDLVARELRVRYRVDGRMEDRGEAIPAPLHASLISRIKVLAGLDITNRRLPQDGRFGVRVGKDAYDLRVSTLPTLRGEKVAMRLLDSGRLERSLDALVTWERARDAFRAILYQPSGLLLVTGPSGSGKTTTLYASILERMAPELSIATVEDPVEYEIPGITQVPISLETGLDFPTAIRTFLRQSPDVMLVGEVRDRQVAELTANAALTGHLVLSSFHTNDALGGIARLHDMQIEPFVLSSALVGIVNQRLVRRLCPSCREPGEATPLVVESLARASVPATAGMPVFRARGCPACGGTGFKGRVGVYEVLDVEAPLREAIARRADSVTLREAARQGVHLTLGEYAGWLIATGHTVPTEALRVLPMA